MVIYFTPVDKSLCFKRYHDATVRGLCVLMCEKYGRSGYLMKGKRDYPLSLSDSGEAHEVDSVIIRISMSMCRVYDLQVLSCCN